MTPDRVLERSQVVPVDVEEVFAFFADAWNLEAITPPWLRFQILEAPRTLSGGRCSCTGYGSSVCRSTGVPRSSSGDPRPASQTCSSRADIVAGSTVTGSAPSTAEPRPNDSVVYRLRYEPVPGLLASVTVRPWLSATFDYRARQTEAPLQ